MLSIHSEQMYFMVKKKMRIPSSIGLGRIIRKCFHFPKGSKLFGSELFSHHTVCIVIFPCQVLMIVEATFLTLITGTTVMRQEKAARPTHVIKMKNVQRWIHNEKWWKIASADLKKNKKLCQYYIFDQDKFPFNEGELISCPSTSSLKFGSGFCFH